jgi:PKD repeat protein
MKYFLSFIAFTLIVLSSYSQQEEDETWRCLTDQVYWKLIEKNPNLLYQKQYLDEFVKEYIKNNPKSDDDELYIIPVVFHVVHNYGEENISYQQILDAVEQMNIDYRKMRPDTASIHPAFKGIAADTKIEFRLAKIDPWGNCTIGVIRTVSQATSTGYEAAKYASPTWPPEKYLNIWTVKVLGEGAAGWSYYPGTAPYGSDGIILLHNYVGVNGTSNIGHGSVLTHEAGHYLNLPHPWGNSNEPGLPSNCYIDDGIEDTPNTIGHTTCNINAVTCGSLDNVQNFMDYSYCYRMFTNGQAAVMRATLNSTVADRNNLHSQSNLIATGTNPGYTAQVCEPISDFISQKKLACTGSTVIYNDLTHNTDFIGAYNWTIENANPSFSNQANPSVIYEQAGIFDVTLMVENESGSDTKTRENYIRVYDATQGKTLAYTESFESSVFPLEEGEIFNDFYFENKGESHWERSNYSFSGQKSLKISSNNNTIDTRNRVYLPNIYVEDTSENINVSLKCAYGRIAGNTPDKLYFYTSTACGDSAQLVYLFTGAKLTSTYVQEYGDYVPAPEDWQTHSFVINKNRLKTNNLRLIIEAVSGNGKALYIDDVKFEQEVSTISETYSNLNVQVYPNPFVNELYIQNYENNKLLKFSITDYTGKLIVNKKYNSDFIDASNIAKELPAGIYFLKLESEKENKIIKLVKAS